MTEEYGWHFSNLCKGLSCSKNKNHGKLEKTAFPSQHPSEWPYDDNGQKKLNAPSFRHTGSLHKPLQVNEPRQPVQQCSDKIIFFWDYLTWRYSLLTMKGKNIKRTESGKSEFKLRLKTQQSSLKQDHRWALRLFRLQAKKRASNFKYPFEKVKYSLQSSLNET